MKRTNKILKLISIINSGKVPVLTKDIIRNKNAQINVVMDARR